MDEGQVRVIEVLANVLAKLILAIATAGVFVMVSVKLVLDPSWPIAAADAFMSATVYVVFKHYFPAKG